MELIIKKLFYLMVNRDGLNIKKDGATTWVTQSLISIGRYQSGSSMAFTPL